MGRLEQATHPHACAPLGHLVRCPRHTVLASFVPLVTSVHTLTRRECETAAPLPSLPSKHS